MALKTLLAIVLDVEEASPLVAAAAALARLHDAHLDLLALGIDEVQLGYSVAGADIILQETALQAAQEAAATRLDAARTALEAEAVRGAAEGLVVQAGLLGSVVGQAARFADLVVMALPAPGVTGREAEAVLEAVLFAGGAPLLTLPGATLPEGFPRRAVIGWNEGAEALRAVRGALPLLQRTDLSVVTVVEPPLRGRDAAPPGTRLSTLLDRHGVKAEIDLLPRTQPRVADILADQVRDRDADLLIAGAYGHSRFREALLGGATRDLLGAATVPLAMAH